MSQQYLVTCDRCGEEKRYKIGQNDASQVMVRIGNDNRHIYDMCKECAVFIKEVIEDPSNK